ncbi:MAG: phage regulatory CII family protein [Desulforhopalus sp.]
MYSKEQIKVLGIVQETMKGYGVKMLASKLQVTPQTLYSDVDPNSIGRRTNKLGLLDWLVTLKETQDFTSLEEANRIFDRISLPIPAPPEEMTKMSWMSFCATIAKESGEVVAELASSIIDGNMDADEIARCEKEAMDALEAFAGFYLALKSCKIQKS